MTTDPYLHGYTTDEQQRLIAQAHFWKDTLILPGLQYAPGERVLDIGCGVGACLHVLSRAFPGIEVTGIDIEHSQIAAAQAYLENAGIRADLRVGDAANLPWEDMSFDRVFLMWILEHTRQHEDILQEAFRVLKPGGTITIIETDYRSFLANPSHPDFEYLRKAQYDIFNRLGNPEAGPQLGPLLLKAGFRNVRNDPFTFHYFSDHDDEKLKALTDYITGFLEGYLETMAHTQGLDLQRLRRGFEYLQTLHTRPDSAFTQLVFKARGTRE